MTDDPRRVVERLNDSINAHDPAAGRALFADDARFVTATGRVLNLGGMGQLLSDTVAAFPDMRMRIERWIVDGGTVVTEEVMEGTHLGDFAGLSPTRRRVELRMCHVTRVADGRIVERVAYHDTAGILRQLG
ncbi:MAG TPA: ester cyclase [Acidimicrobiales bacterium]